MEFIARRVVGLGLVFFAMGCRPPELIADGGTIDAGSDSGATDSGATDSGVKTPAWLAGKPLDSWFTIPGTEGAGGSSIDAYSGFALREDTSELWIAAAGGHAAGLDNRVVSLDLRADSPTWISRHATSSVTEGNVAYYADGTPASRHVYQSIHWVGSIHRVILSGLRYTHPGSYTFGTVDGFNPDTNMWDPKGTWRDAAPGHYGIVRDDRDRVWTNALSVWSPMTNTWSSPITTAAPAVSVRFPAAFDSKRKQLFTLQWGDGQGFDPQQRSASRVPVDGTTQYAVSFTPSATVAAFDAAKPTYAAMDYDPDHDRFVFYDGVPAHGFIAVTPNDGDTWDMSAVVFAAGSATIPLTGGGGIQNRLRYVPQLGGFVMLTNAANPLYFLRTR